MVRLTERILLIGDVRRDVYGALVQAAPGAQVTSVATVFDAITELVGAGNGGGGYTTILAAAEPIERRPEAAVRTLRSLAGPGRLVLFGHPTLELLSRKMMQFGCDDYIVTPASAGEIQQIFGTPRLRLAEPSPDDGAAEPVEGAAAAPPAAADVFSSVPLSEVLLDALLQHPHDAATAAVRAIHAHLSPRMALSYRRSGSALPDPVVTESQVLLSQTVRSHGEEAGTLYLALGRDEDPSA